MKDAHQLLFQAHDLLMQAASLILKASQRMGPALAEGRIRHIVAEELHRTTGAAEPTASPPGPPEAIAAGLLLRLPRVKEVTGLGRTTVYGLMREGKFPPPVKLGARSVAWSSDAVRAWVEARVRGTQYEAPPPAPPSQKAAKPSSTYPPLDRETRKTISTEAAAFYLGRRPQTLRTWATYEKGPLRPVRVNGRLAWPVDEIKRLLKGEK